MDRVMVVKGKLASLRLTRDEEGEVESRVAPADLVAVLLPAELGVMDDQVGAPAPLDVLVVQEALQRLRRAAGRLARSPRRECVRASVGFAAGGEDKGVPIFLEPVAEGRDRVVHGAR